MKKAFTLVELLICIGIIAALAAIIPMSAFIQARKSALVADETSRLRQLSTAFALYESDYERQQYGTSLLVDLGYVPQGLLSSSLDPTLNGIANNVAEAVHIKMKYRNEVASYRSSFPSFLVFGQVNESFARVRDQPQAGWLVSLSSTKTEHLNSYAGIVHGTYLRLLFGRIDCSSLSELAEGQRKRE